MNKRKFQITPPYISSNGEQIPTMATIQPAKRQPYGLRSSVSVENPLASPMLADDTNQAGGTGQVSERTPNFAGFATNCKFCNLVLNIETITCDRCQHQFHPSGNCTGLKPLTIRAILEEGSDGIKFVCVACRCAPGTTQNGEWKEALGQVFELVRSLSIGVANLTKTVNKVVLNSPQVSQTASAASDHPITNSNANITLEKKDLYTELWEFEERKKRLSSVIVRGINATNNAEFSNQFKAVYRHLLNADPAIESTHCINQENKMYRVKFTDKAQRVEIMQKARELKDSEYRNVYITRDLTLTQRKEIAARRAAARGQRDNRRTTNRRQRQPGDPPVNGANAVPVAAATSSAGAAGGTSTPSSSSGSFH